MKCQMGFCRCHHLQVNILFYFKKNMWQLGQILINRVKHAYHLWYLHTMTSPSSNYVVGLYVFNLFEFDEMDLIWDIIY